MAKETIELSFSVDVSAFGLKLPKTLALSASQKVNYSVENDITYDVALSTGLTGGNITATIVSDINENKFLQIVVGDTIDTQLAGTITITPQGQDPVEIVVTVESNKQPEPVVPTPDEPDFNKPDIDDDSDVPDDGSLFLKFVGVTENQKIEIKERRHKIIYFKTSGDRYTIASAVEGNVTVQTAEEIAKEKAGNAYKVVKLKITGVATSSDVKISVTAERGQDDPVVV